MPGRPVLRLGGPVQADASSIFTVSVRAGAGRHATEDLGASHYKLAAFSMERLMTLLTALDQDVEIVIKRKPASRRAARIRVEAN